MLSDVNKITDNAKIKNLNDRASEQLKVADESYLEGVQYLQQSDPLKAIESFKKAFKNYKRIKFNENALNYPNLQLAVAHQLSEDERNRKKVVRYLDLITKSIEKEKEWLYNLAVLHYLSKNEQQAAEYLESVIKMDRYFFKAYGNLAAVYQQINDPKKASKTLENLTFAQESLAEKQRKEQLALSKKSSRKGDRQSTKTR